MSEYKTEVAPAFTRFDRSSSVEAFQYQEGGKYDAGMIENVSVITRGEALGHDAWIDAPFLDQVAEAINESENGIKARFTHPSMSSDGLGKLLGRVMNARVEGDKVLADLHFATSATKTPDGNLVEYVRLLIDEDSDAAGLSIVFEHDEKAERDFHLQNGAEPNDSIFEPDDLDLSGFKSPDEMNVENIPHVRLSKLRAADLVDEPAANPDGIYSASSLPVDADKFLRFMVGEQIRKPDALFGVDAERASEFFQRWLRSNGYSLAKGSAMEPEEKATENVDDDSVEYCETCGSALAEESDDEQPNDVSENQPEGDSDEQPEGDSEQQPESESESESDDEQSKVSSESRSFSKSDFVTELKKYTDAFGIEQGQKWFESGVSFSEGFERLSKSLGEEKEQLQKRVSELEATLSAIEFGERDGLGIGVSDDSIKKPMTFAQFTRSQKN